MPHPEAIIAIHDGRNEPRKAVRLVTMRDGSFSVAVPYHPQQAGELFKFRSRPDLSYTGEGPTELVESMSVDVPVKLVYHASGFTQFSSGGRGRVQSGRRPAAEFLLPKGLAITAQPITNPVETGPTVGVQFFNLGECKVLTMPQKVRTIIFGENDFFEWDEHPAHYGHAYRHVYTVDVYVFPGEQRRSAILRQGKWWLIKEISPLRPDLTTAFRIVDLTTPIAFLGIHVERKHVAIDDPEHLLSGYNMAGPRDIASGLHIGGLFHPERPPTADDAADVGPAAARLRRSGPE